MKSAVVLLLILSVQVSLADTKATVCENEIIKVISAIPEEETNCLTVSHDVLTLTSIMQEQRIQEACLLAPRGQKKDALLALAFLRKELALAHRTQTICERE